MILDIILENPRISIIVISIAVTLLITSIRYFVSDREKMKASREKQKEFKQKIKDARAQKDDAKLAELTNEMIQHQMSGLKDSFKPMLYTLLPVLVIFYWVKGVFSETTIASTWLWWYIGTAIVSSIVLNKVFKLS